MYWVAQYVDKVSIIRLSSYNVGYTCSDNTYSVSVLCTVVPEQSNICLELKIVSDYAILFE